MAFLSKILGSIRGTAPKNTAENDEETQFQLNCIGDHLCTQGLPEVTEAARHGDVWLGINSAVNALPGYPTTTASLGLWNGEPQGAYGKSYIPLIVGSYISTTLGAAALHHLYGQVCTTPVAAQTSLLIPKSLSGRKNYKGMGGHKASVTVTANAWHPIVSHENSSDYAMSGGGSVVCANTANLMLAVVANCKGRYLIPPGGMFGLCSVGTATTASTLFIIWQEALIALG